jgi:glyoxylase-like metal-dependent hydrolase (beta-lactamase superfamily II)
VDAPYAFSDELEPGIVRVLAANPSAFTFTGTQTYLVGEREVAVIDPGPDLPEHLDALMAAVAGRRVAAIMCTHTHRDHSLTSRPLAESDRRSDRRLCAFGAGKRRPARTRRSMANTNQIACLRTGGG